jgi:hypothetical protein
MVHQQGNNVYGEVEALSVLLGYKTANAGCCKVGCGAGPGQAACTRVPAQRHAGSSLPPAAACTAGAGGALPFCAGPPAASPSPPPPQIVLHPKWGSSVYPASLFTRAPADVLLAAINEVQQALGAR